MASTRRRTIGPQIQASARPQLTFEAGVNQLVPKRRNYVDSQHMPLLADALCDDLTPLRGGLPTTCLCISEQDLRAAIIKRHQSGTRMPDRSFIEEAEKKWNTPS